MTKSRLITLALLAVLAVPSPAQATIGPRDTRISVGREWVDRSSGTERLTGKVVVRAPGGWTRSSHDTAPSATFKVAGAGGCSAVVDVSVRAIATRQRARSRARGVTRAPLSSVIADTSRPGGWLRLIRLPGGQEHTIGADAYGIAIVRLADNRWIDVRAFSWFSGCSDEQIRSGSASTGLRVLLHDARIHARIVRSRVA